MKGGGPGRPKLECGIASSRSATRLPISWGELPAGHFLNSFGCFCACRGRVSTIIPAASSNPNVVRYRFIMSSLSPYVLPVMA